MTIEDKARAAGEAIADRTADIAQSKKRINLPVWGWVVIGLALIAVGALVFG